MRLRDALDLCTDAHMDDWITMPGGGRGRPATAMVAGMFDPGMTEPNTRPLAGHTIAVYEPDARLSLVWPLPEDDDERSGLPEWAEDDVHSWKSARHGWTVVLLDGTPIWQEPMWYLGWGSGVGGYVPDFEPRFGDYDEEVGGGVRKLDGWDASTWSIALANLINSFSHTAGEFGNVDPTLNLVPSPLTLHPIDARRVASG